MNKEQIEKLEELGFALELPEMPNTSGYIYGNDVGSNIRISKEDIVTLSISSEDLSSYKALCEIYNKACKVLRKVSILSITDTDELIKGDSIINNLIKRFIEIKVSSDDIRYILEHLCNDDYTMKMFGESPVVDPLHRTFNIRIQVTGKDLRF